MKPITTFAEAEAFLFHEVPKTSPGRIKDELSLAKSQHFFDLLGNPQDACKAIHIAGTSGKGTTAYVIAALLDTVGKKVGLNVSPHVYDVRERIQINGQMVTEDQMVSGLNELTEAYNKMANSEFGPPTYFEVISALAFVIFRGEGLDYAVIETGMGGRFDSTNTISRRDKLAVLTQIGMDHTRLLGDSIQAIARQKAGIITADHAIALWQESEGWEAFEEQAEIAKSRIEYVQPWESTEIVEIKPGNSIFNLTMGRWRSNNLHVALTGEHQVANVALGLRAVQYLGERDGFGFNQALARKALRSLTIPGRFQVITLKGKTVILDGAHNPQKLGKLADTLRVVYPDKKFTFLVAMGEAKDSTLSLQQLLPIASTFVFTSFFSDNQDFPVRPQPPEQLGKQLAQLGSSAFETVDKPVAGLARALELTDEVLVITGSFYLLGELKDEVTKEA